MSKRALISVSDKRGVAAFARALSELGYELISTGGTAQTLRAEQIPVREVSALTGVPEMMDGRVKTLHPAIHGGLLARRDLPAHQDDARANGIGMIDLLVVDLYPFEKLLGSEITPEALIEQIDIGGPAMIRSAAKNFDAVSVVVDPQDYGELLAALRQADPQTLGPLRRRLAAKAFARTAAYDTLIAAWLQQSCAGESQFPPHLLDARRKQTLRYGENPQQQAALYLRHQAHGGIAAAAQLQGKELSYNNLADADAAMRLVLEFDAPAAVLVKHGNPCGVATGSDAAEAFSAALACDPQSAFGGILALNRTVEALVVEAIDNLFLEVIIAPEVTAAAADLLAARKNLRVLTVTPEVHASPLARWQVRSISGGYLLQQLDPADTAGWRLIAGAAPAASVESDARLAWRVVKHALSNAIVLAKNGHTTGIGAGQMSRVDAVRIAIEQARRHGHGTQGAVLASDAFFPFADNVELAAEAGIAAIVQPGGSVRDAEVIAACAAHGIALWFTDTRHFRH